MLRVQDFFKFNYFLLQCAVTSCDSLKTPTTTTSLAISISSPNLATNTSFSSSSDSDYLENVNGAKSVITIQNLLDDNHSIDTNNNDDHEPLNLAGENDVEYAELTQRMIFPNTPSNVSHQPLDNATSDSSDLMLMNLFDGASRSESSSSSTHSSNNHQFTAASRPIISTSVLEKMSETALHHSSLNGANTSLTNLPSLDVSNNHDNNSLSHELTAHHTSVSTSPVWKTQVSKI